MNHLVGDGSPAPVPVSSASLDKNFGEARASRARVHPAVTTEDRPRSSDRSLPQNINRGRKRTLAALSLRHSRPAALEISVTIEPGRATGCSRCWLHILCHREIYTTRRQETSNSARPPPRAVDPSFFILRAIIPVHPSGRRGATPLSRPCLPSSHVFITPFPITPRPCPSRAIHLPA